MIVGDKIPEILGTDQDGREIKASLCFIVIPRPTLVAALLRHVLCKHTRKN